MDTTGKRKNPSRKDCENIIRRILMTEVLEKGCNEHFKSASDFLGYFQSLYPASDSLTKQVQRAVHSMNMPRDSKGYFVINKTEEQLEQDEDISHILRQSSAEFDSLDDCETLFLSVSPERKSYLLQLISCSDTFADKYVTIIESTNGLIFYTRNKTNLKMLIESLMR